MVNAISVGKMPIRMKLGEDVDLKASYKINYILLTLIRGRLTSQAAIKYIIQDSVMPTGHMTLALAASEASHVYILKKNKK